MSARPLAMAPCSVITACTKLPQSSKTKGEVTAKTRQATTKASARCRTACDQSAGPSCLDRHVVISTATTGAARIGNALNLEAMARPAPRPVRAAAPAVRRSTISIAPYSASKVKVVEMGSTAKKWASWIWVTVKAERAAANSPAVCP